MKVTIVGSSQYEKEMQRAKEGFEKKGHEVRLPILDHDTDGDELSIINENLANIKWADVIGFLWDGRSVGALGDWHMAYALDKPIILLYLEEKKTPVNGVKKYGEICKCMARIKEILT